MRRVIVIWDLFFSGWAQCLWDIFWHRTFWFQESLQRSLWKIDTHSKLHDVYIGQNIDPFRKEYALTFNSASRTVLRNFIRSSQFRAAYFLSKSKGSGLSFDLRLKCCFPIDLPGNFLEIRMGAHISLSLRNDRLVCPFLRSGESPLSNSSIRKWAYSISIYKRVTKESWVVIKTQSYTTKER